MSQRSGLGPAVAGIGALLLVLVAAAGAWFAFDEGFRAQRAALAQSGPDEFEERVRRYLLENPEVIAEAIERLQEKRRVAERNEVQSIITARANELLRDPASPVGGNPDGDVTIVEFFDYNCPYCRKMGPVMVELEQSDPNLRIVYKEFPVLGPNSTAAAKVALAAHRQGKYDEYHKTMMHAQGAADEASALKLAEELGLDMERLKEDMSDPEIEAAINRNLALAQELRINGTPTFVIGEEIVPGQTVLRVLRQMVERARQAQ